MEAQPPPPAAATTIATAASSCPPLETGLPARARERRLVAAFEAMGAGLALHFFLILGKGSRPYALDVEETISPAVDAFLSISLLVLLFFTIVWLVWMVLFNVRPERRDPIRRFLKPVKVPGIVIILAYPLWAVTFEVILDLDELANRGGFAFNGWSNETFTFAAFAAVIAGGVCYAVWYRACISQVFSISPAGFVPAVYGRANHRGRQIPWDEVQGGELIIGRVPKDGSPRPFEWILQTRKSAVCEITSDDLAGSGLAAGDLKTLAAAVRTLNDAIEAQFPSSARRIPLAKRRHLIKL